MKPLLITSYSIGFWLSLLVGGFFGFLVLLSGVRNYKTQFAVKNYWSGVIQLVLSPVLSGFAYMGFYGLMLMFEEWHDKLVSSSSSTLHSQGLQTFVLLILLFLFLIAVNTLVYHLAFRSPYMNTPIVKVSQK